MPNEHYGNTAKFVDLRNTYFPDGVSSFETFIARMLANKMGRKQDVRAIERALSEKAKAGLTVILDDFDEVHRN